MSRRRAAKAKYPTDPTDAASLVRKIAELLRREGVRIVGLEQFYKAGDTQVAAETLGLYAEGYTAGLVRGTVIEAIAISCMKACDSASADRYTIPTARHLLADPVVFTEVAAGGDRIALDHFMHLADDVAKDYSTGRLRDFRNYRLAHNIPEEFAKVPTAKLLHLWQGTELALQTIYHLVAGTGLATVSFDADASVWRERCEAYWYRLVQGPQGRQVIRG